MCHITVVVTPCRQLLCISVPAVAQGSHVQPQRSKSELPVLWPQLCLAAQWHWLWWPGERLSHDLPAYLLHMCMDRRMLQVHVAGANSVCDTLVAADSATNRPSKSSMALSSSVLVLEENTMCSTQRCVGATQVGYWSLFVDGLFENGMSHKGATYTNPASLSADTKFEVTAPGYASLQPSPPELAAAQT